MTPENFVYWLQGFFEILSAGPKTAEKLTLTAEQVKMIETHLGYVFARQEQLKLPTITFNPPSVPPYNPPIQPVIQPGGQQQPWPGYPNPLVTCQAGQQAGITGGPSNPLAVIC